MTRRLRISVGFALVSVVLLLVVLAISSPRAEEDTREMSESLKKDLAAAQSAAVDRERREADALGTLEELRARAMQGDYQSQRNLAYRLANGDAGAAKNAIEACAWRIVILTSGNSAVNQTDVGNKRVDCNEHLAADELAAAIARATRLSEQISGRF